MEILNSVYAQLAGVRDWIENFFGGIQLFAQAPQDVANGTFSFASALKQIIDSVAGAIDAVKSK